MTLAMNVVPLLSKKLLQKTSRKNGYFCSFSPGGRTVVILDHIWGHVSERTLTLFGGGGFKTPSPFRFFLCDGQTPQDIQLWWLFLTIHSAHFSKKEITGSCQVRSPEQVYWPHLRDVCSHVRARVFFFSRNDFLSSRSHYNTSMCNFDISEFVNMWPEVRSETWPLHYKPMGKSWNVPWFE